MAALIIRAPRFGDPNIHVDESFYLHVAELMLDGALPYVDVWDRKPVGLFILYAGIRLLGGDGILQYQLVATLFALGTAFIVTSISRRSSGWLGSCAAGVAYLAFLSTLGGAGGQSPVFYNLFVAAAGLLTLKALDADGWRAVTRLGAGAMLLCGVAIQIKYTAVVEGCFFGLVLLWILWSRSRSLQKALLWGCLFACLGILPTAFAAAIYAYLGHLDAFVFANFTSISLRPPTASSDLQTRLFWIGMVLLPLLAALFVRLIQKQGQLSALPRVTLFTAGWIGAAVGGFAVIGTFYSHYALPLLVPLAIGAAPLFDRRPVGTAVGAFTIFWAMALTSSGSGTRVSQQRIAQMNEVVEANLKGGCLFVFEGPPAVAYATKACSATPYVFPYHLSLEIERRALGVDPAAEVRRVLATRPTVIMSTRDTIMEPNAETRAILHAALERDYREISEISDGKREYQIYARK